MATDPHVALVEEAIGYTFRRKCLLRLALTAAGADPENHDGNRKLASVGQAASRLAICDKGYEISWPRGKYELEMITTLSNKIG